MRSDYTVLNKGKGNCPVCGADHNNSNKCKQSNDSGIISCYRENSAEIGGEVNGYRFVGEKDSWGLWKPAELWTDEPSAERPRKEPAKEIKHVPLAALDLRLGDPIDTSKKFRPINIGYKLFYNDGRWIERDERKSPKIFKPYRPLGDSWDSETAHNEGDRSEWYFYAQDIIKPGGTLLLVEGEQTVIGALGAGFQAVASCHGMGASDTDFLALRLGNGIKQNWDGVVYVADNDKAGLDKAENMRLAAAKIEIPFTIINAGDIPELVDIEGGSIDDLTTKLDGSGMGLKGEEVLARLEAAFASSEGTEEALGDEDLLEDMREAEEELSSGSNRLTERDYLVLMPDAVQSAAKEIKDYRLVPPSALYAAMLAAASIALGKKHTWRLLDIGKFKRSAQFWALVIASSGSDKSSVLDLTCGPLQQLDKTDADNYEYALEELEAHKRLKGDSEAVKVERFEMEKNLPDRRERIVTDNSSFKGMLETIKEGNSDGVLHYFDETHNHFKRLGDKKPNADNWNPDAEISLYEGKKTGFRNRGERVVVENGFLYNRYANIQPERLAESFQLSEGQGGWARWLIIRTACEEVVLEDFVKSAQAETAFQEQWDPILWQITQMEGTTWMPATLEDFNVYQAVSAETERLKFSQKSSVAKAFFSKVRGALGSLILINAAIRVASEGGTVGEWTTEDVHRSKILLLSCGEELTAFATKYQESESAWSSNARELLDKPWFKSQEIGAKLKTSDVQNNCRIHGLKAKGFKALFEEMATTLPTHFEIWSEGRSSGIKILRSW